MKVLWTDNAESDLVSIYEYIARNSTVYALRTIDRIIGRGEQIAVAPLSGRRVPEYDMGQIRELIEGPYRIIYHIKADCVEAIAVIHGARNFFGVMSEDQ